MGLGMTTLINSLAPSQPTRRHCPVPVDFGATPHPVSLSMMYLGRPFTSL